MLISLPPARIQAVVAEARKAGLAEEGPDWALKQETVGALVKSLLPALRKEMEHDQGLG
jgi:hypothetical protein